MIQQDNRQDNGQDDVTLPDGVGCEADCGSEPAANLARVAVRVVRVRG